MGSILTLFSSRSCCSKSCFSFPSVAAPDPWLPPSLRLVFPPQLKSWYSGSCPARGHLQWWQHRMVKLKPPTSLQRGRLTCPARHPAGTRLWRSSQGPPGGNQPPTQGAAGEGGLQHLERRQVSPHYGSSMLTNPRQEVPLLLKRGTQSCPAPQACPLPLPIDDMLPPHRPRAP